MAKKSALTPLEIEQHTRIGLVQASFSAPVAVDQGRSRFLHGPALTRADNGDWLLAYQDGDDDPGRGSVIRLQRSVDGGQRWQDEGVIFDETQAGYGARNPAFGQTFEGRLILVVQRVGLKKLGDVKGENIMGSALLISEDNGQHFEHRGMVDPKRRRGHQGCSTHLVYWRLQLLMPAFHPKGLVLYISQDDGETWPERIPIAPRELFEETPYYPTLATRPDHSLLMVGHLNQAVQNFWRTSVDEGRTWSEVGFYQDLALRHPVLGYAGETLVCLGRNMDAWKPAIAFSADNGGSWSPSYDLFPGLGAGGGYTALWPTGKPGELMIAASTAGSEAGAQDIYVTRLSAVSIER